jgi:nifR3 family TIM-barrel protein
VRQPFRLGQVPIASRFFLAPLAGYTSLAFRLTVRQCGGLGLATTDLVNARSLIERRRRAFELAETCAEDRPLSIQIYGVVIAEMEQAARWVEQQGASAVDINMGCPVRKVVKTGGGSALMCQIDQAVDLVSAVVKSVGVPVTVKMRLGWDDDSLTAPSLARAFEQAGVAAVIVHGRTRAQGFAGSVNRAGIRAVVDAVERIPIVANGDIRTIADVAQAVPSPLAQPLERQPVRRGYRSCRDRRTGIPATGFRGFPRAGSVRGDRQVVSDLTLHHPGLLVTSGSPHSPRG